MTIYYVCNWDAPSGGIKVLYDHVRVLRSLGFDAALGACARFVRCIWFDHDAAETPAVERVLDVAGPDDWLVVPEIALHDAPLLRSPARRVAFVQNHSLIPRGVAWGRFERAMTASDPLIPYVRDVAGARFPVVSVPHFLESAHVAPPRRPTRTRHPRVLAIPRERKHRGEPYLAAWALEAAGFEVDVRDRPMHRRDFVALFREHDVYLHLSRPEGFPGPVIEAFGAGCLVVGFAGVGGLHFMRHGENCLLAEDGDWRRAVDHVLALSAADPESSARLLAAARETSCRYDEAAFARSLLEAWAPIRAPA
jgi:hypothetical protein